MVKNISFWLSGSASYYSGSKVSGRLIIEVDNPKKYKKIQVELVGLAEVHWTEQSSDDHHNNITHHKNKDVFLNNSVTVWKKEDGVDGKLQPGRHSFPFEFTIPPSCPSSFESNYGWIRYNMIGKISGGLLKADHSRSTGIQVSHLMNVNETSLTRPVRAEKQKNVGFLCCAAGSVTFTVSLEQTGFIRGRILPFHVDIANASSRTARLTASLTRNDVFTSKGGKLKASSTSVSVTSSQVIQGGETSEWSGELSLPSSLPLTMTQCSCISVSYMFRVVLKVPRATDVSLKNPVVIGNTQEASSEPLLCETIPELSYGSTQSGQQSAARVHIPGPVQPYGVPPGQAPYGQVPHRVSDAQLPYGAHFDAVPYGISPVPSSSHLQTGPAFYGLPTVSTPYGTPFQPHGTFPRSSLYYGPHPDAGHVPYVMSPIPVSYAGAMPKLTQIHKDTPQQSAPVQEEAVPWKVTSMHPGQVHYYATPVEHAAGEQATLERVPVTPGTTMVNEQPTVTASKAYQEVMDYDSENAPPSYDDAVMSGH